MNNSHMLPNMLFYAFRYALGRSSYAVSDTINFLSSNLNLFSKADKERMIREIEEAEKHNMLGMEKIDKPLWLSFKNTLIESNK